MNLRKFLPFHRWRKAILEKWNPPPPPPTCICPCCGYRTLDERGGYDICPVCYWEDDGQDDEDADVVKGGPNGDLSLTQARQNFKKYGAADIRDLSAVRSPNPGELPGNDKQKTPDNDEG